MSTNPLQRVPPHVVVRDVMPAAEHAALLAWAVAQGEAGSASQLGESQPKLNSRVRDSVALPLAPELDAMLRARAEKMMPALVAGIGIQPFALHSIETSLIAHGDGGRYLRHVDLATGTGRTGSDRLVTAVYYFHAEPKGFTGGALRLHALRRGPDDRIAHADIEPVQNSLVCFPAWALHEVLPVRVPSGRFSDYRFSVNCWFRRKSDAA